MKKVILFALAIISLTSCETEVQKEVRKSLEGEIETCEYMIEIYEAQFDSISPIYLQLLDDVLEDKIGSLDFEFTNVEVGYNFTYETLTHYEDRLEKAKYKLATL